jgi:oligopeptide/dipeptide ABC transporter ATP-binding protein
MREGTPVGTLEARDVSVSFPVRRRGAWPWSPASQLRAVQNVSFTLRRGEMLGIAGESGCGKSTLARVLLRLQAPSSGAVLLDGQPTESYPPLGLRRRIQMVFQDPFGSLNPRRTAGSIVGDALVVHTRMRARDRRARVVAMFERVGLGAEHVERYPHEFSGGQRQRIAIARALMLDPEFLVLDEPTSSLDVSVQARVINLIRELSAELTLGCLFITHDLNLLSFLTQRLAVMYLGEIVEIGATTDVFADPLHPYTTALIAATPQPDPDRRRERKVLQGEVPSAVTRPTGCSFHTRCPSRIGAICDEVPPDLQPVRGRLVRCHLYPGTAS